MRVSLKKPYKVDLSKPPLEPKVLREYTPEHLTEEIFPNQPLKAYTPEHICEEVTPERVCTPKHIKTEQIPREKDISADKQQHHEISAIDGMDILIIVISVIAVIVTICVCVFAIAQEPSESTSTIDPVETASDVVTFVKELLARFVDDGVFGFLFVLVSVAVFVGAIRRMFNMCD